MSELTLRILSAAVAAPLVILAIYLGDAALASLIGIASAVGAWEFYRMAAHTGVRPMVALGVPMAAAIPLLVHAYHLRVIVMPLSGAVLLVLLVLAASVAMRGVEGKPMSATATTVFGVLYVGATLSFAYGLRYHRFTVDAIGGTALVKLPLLLTWASDTGAYFTGRAIGGRKLAPTVSPGKTVAGAAGGLVFTMIVAWLLGRHVLPDMARLGMTVQGALLFGALISVAAQVGDLAESMLKREAGVKDSSRIIPGHGGVLDRVDSLLFTLPLGYFLVDLLTFPAIR